MGADLYINSLSDKCKEKYEPLFEEWVEKRNSTEDIMEKDKCQKKVSEYYDKMMGEGYYRDSYNDSNLLWKYGLSYWDWFGKLLDKEGNLTPTKARIVLMTMDDGINDFGEELKDLSGEEKVFFMKKDKEFRKFLQTAIDLDEPIYCSI